MNRERRRFLKAIFNPFTLLGGVGAYISAKFISGEKKGKDSITYDYYSSPISVGEVKDLGEVFLVRDREGIYAMLAKCTHLGCKPMWNGHIFHCPCHGSEFTEEGDVINGPATKHLVNLMVKKQGRKLIIFLNKKAPFSQRIKV